MGGIRVFASAAVVCALCACTGTGQPSGPAVAAASGSPPVLEAITERQIMQDGYPVIIPEFHFHDADGDVRFLARELLATNGPHEQTQGTAITFPAALQKRGAIFAGRWSCGPNVYYVKMHAYLIDQAGNRSNAMDYSVRCNGAERPCGT